MHPRIIAHRGIPVALERTKQIFRIQVVQQVQIDEIEITCPPIDEGKSLPLRPIP